MKSEQKVYHRYTQAFALGHRHELAVDEARHPAAEGARREAPLAVLVERHDLIAGEPVLRGERGELPVGIAAEPRRGADPEISFDPGPREARRPGS